MDKPDDIPYGYCHCGCGGKATVSHCTRADRGWIKGEPRRYIYGHQSRPSIPRYRVEDTGYKTPCWIWQWSCDGTGYGKWCTGGRGNTAPAHRVMYELRVGLIPIGLEIDHLCRVHACVNPDHLEPVTRQVNQLRGQTIAAMNAAKTHCIHGHPFDAANTYWWRGTRKCRECMRESDRRRRARR